MHIFIQIGFNYRIFMIFWNNWSRADFLRLITAANSIPCSSIVNLLLICSYRIHSYCYRMFSSYCYCRALYRSSSYCYYPIHFYLILALMPIPKEPSHCKNGLKTYPDHNLLHLNLNPTSHICCDATTLLK